MRVGGGRQRKGVREGRKRAARRWPRRWRPPPQTQRQGCRPWTKRAHRWGSKRTLVLGGGGSESSVRTDGNKAPGPGECTVCKSQRTNVSMDEAIGWLMQSAVNRSPTAFRQFYKERFGDLSTEEIDKAELSELIERLKTNMYQILEQWRGQNSTCVFKCICQTQNLCLFVDDSIWKPQGGVVEEKWSIRSCTTTSLDLPHFCYGVWRKLQEKKELATKIVRAGAFFVTDPECDDHVSGSGSSHGSGESAAGMPSEQVPESWILLEEYGWTCIQYQSTSMRCPYIHT